MPLMHAVMTRIAVTTSQKDLCALCICWTSALTLAAAIARGFEWLSLSLLVASLLWGSLAAWLGDSIDVYRIPISRYHTPRLSPQPASALAGPMRGASFFLFTQAVFMPLYRFSWSL